MLCKSSSRVPILLALVLQLATAGCQSRKEQAPEDAGAATAEASPLEPADAGILWPPERPYPAKYYYLDLAGTEDYRNRYSAAVGVATSEPTEAGTHGMCSGVLLSPQLVLTAGHCVCVRRPATTPENAGKLVIDGSSCSQNPTVMTMIWDPSTGDDFIPSSSRSQTHKGVKVQPHPAFQILLNKEGQVESSRADLALIFLEAPVAEPYAPLHMAAEDVHAGETFVLVGGRSDAFQGGSIGGDRRFMRYKAVRFTGPENDRVLFEQPQRDLFKGDSGGPCVREGKAGPVLLGISSRGLGKEPTFTSIHLYRDWLDSALRSIKAR